MRSFFNAFNEARIRESGVHEELGVVHRGLEQLGEIVVLEEWTGVERAEQRTQTEQSR